MGLTLQGLGMLLIVMTACLVGLLSLPVWVAMILRDLQWNQWYSTWVASLRTLRGTVRESNPD